MKSKVKCKRCKELKPYYGKGYCKNCYQSIYMKRFYKKNDKTTMVLSKATSEFISSRMIESDNNKEDTLKRLLGI
jgi:hypothetical protein